MIAHGTLKDVDLISELLSYESAVKLTIWTLAEDKVWMVASSEYDTQIQQYGSELEAVLRFQKIMEENRKTIDKIGGKYKLGKWNKPFHCETEEFWKKAESNTAFPCYFKDEKKERAEQGIQFQLEIPTEEAKAE
jgi:hypothetical protein